MLTLLIEEIGRQLRATTVLSHGGGYRHPTLGDKIAISVKGKHHPSGEWCIKAHQICCVFMWWLYLLYQRVHGILVFIFSGILHNFHI